ncbi:MAG: serine O-acetyltransferase [Alteromonadaceae bacterium]|jgi:serine O-acetyltransferase
MIKSLFKKIVVPLYYTLKLAIRYRDPRFVFSCVISRELPKTTVIPHPVGIVIGKENGVSIGERCTFMQGVTVGVKRLTETKGPTIKNNVFIGPNSVIVGDIVIGENTKVGPNCFVDFDVPANSIIVQNSVSKIR